MRKILVTLLLLLVAFALFGYEADAQANVQQVKQESVVMKATADATSKRVVTLKKGQFVTVQATKGTFSKVKFNTYVGYIPTAALKKATPKVKTMNAGQSLRSANYKAAKTTATLKKNQLVEDFGAVDGIWSFVRYGNDVGYVPTNSLTAPKATTRTVSKNATVRAAASVSSKKLGLINATKKVNYYGSYAGWAYVSSGTLQGFIEAAALKQNKLIVIDPGHQGKGNSKQEPIGPGASQTKARVTSGTTGVSTKKPEYMLTLETAFLLKTQLEKAGYTVKMTRTTHNVDISNSERAKFANNLKADLVIRLHADGSTNRNKRGASILVPGQNSYTKPILKESDRAGKAILNALKPHVMMNGSGYFYRTDLSGFNWSTRPTVLIEMGFMTNPTEDRNMSNKAYMTNYMKYVTNGVNNYFK